MQAIFEFLPLILFFVAYLYKDIYFALIVLMIAMPIGLLVKYVRTQNLDKMYLWSTVFLLGFGGLTLYLRNPIFLYWKPTALNWVIAVVFLASNWIGAKPLARRAMEVTGELPTEQINESQWRRLNLIWVAFFVVVGFLNIYVAYNFSEDFWVKFKVFGLVGISFVFMIAQGYWVVAQMDIDEDSTEKPE